MITFLTNYHRIPKNEQLPDMCETCESFSTRRQCWSSYISSGCAWSYRRNDSLVLFPKVLRDVSGSYIEKLKMADQIQEREYPFDFTTASLDNYRLVIVPDKPFRCRKIIIESGYECFRVESIHVGIHSQLHDWVPATVFGPHSMSVELNMHTATPPNAIVIEFRNMVHGFSRLIGKLIGLEPVNWIGGLDHS